MRNVFIFLVVGLIFGGFYLLSQDQQIETVEMIPEKITKSKVIEVAKVTPEKVLTRPKIKKRRKTRKVKAHETKLTRHDKSVIEAMERLEEGDREGAFQILKDILEENPNHLMALEEMAMYHVEGTKEIGKAFNYFERILKVDPDNALAIEEASYLIEQQEGPEGSEVFLKEMIDKNPNGVNTRRVLAQSFSNQGRFSEAIREWETLKSIGEVLEDSAEISKAYVKVGNFAKGYENFRNIRDRASAEIAQMEENGVNSDQYRKEQSYYGLEFAHTMLEQKICNEEILQNVENSIQDGPELEAYKVTKEKRCP